MPAVARYLFSLQGLQNQGKTLLLEGKMEEGHRVQYDDYLTFAKCANCFFLQVGAKSFIIPNDKDIYCVPCFEDKVFPKKVALLDLITIDYRLQRNAQSAKEF